MKAMAHAQIQVQPTGFDAKRWVFLGVVGVLLWMACDVALAADPFEKTALATALKNLTDALNGAVARSLAVVAVIGAGIMALTGRMEWSRAVVVVLGVGLIFSASAMIEALFPVAK
jgi:type IV secretory pathway VirB2 component (pilin)